ncbi:ABC-type transport auxiliary lipoprotein family protein [Methylopila sp. 73B]|uniref:ABC-type transport auxiliary lipoprotein family protein n=1 Tax=Methylopila sp. 73B TaxID=1120792 RepID=UPI0003A8FD54|nr:ABC-type transport auxiliary lipoprotein family protein [Methylopila sp. 73B]
MTAPRTRSIRAKTLSAKTLSATALLLAGVALAGCSSLLAGKPPATYDLTAPTDLPRGGSQKGNLVVGEPVAVAVIDGQRIVVKPDAGQVTYLPDSQWSDRLPKLVQAKIIEAYENANRLKSVGRPGDRLAVDYQLVTELRAFEIRAGQGQAVVELTAKIVSDKTGRIVAGEVFQARQPLPGAVDGPTATRALNAALADVLRGLVAWTGQRL